MKNTKIYITICSAFLCWLYKLSSSFFL